MGTVQLKIFLRGSKGASMAQDNRVYECTLNVYYSCLVKSLASEPVHERDPSDPDTLAAVPQGSPEW